MSSHVTGPFPGTSCPTRPRSAPTGGCSVGGVDLLDLADEHRHAAVRLRRGPPAGPLPGGGGRLRRRGGLRVEGLPVPGHGPPGPRGGHARRRGHRRRAARGPGRGRPRRPPRPPRQQQVGGASWPGPTTSACGWWSTPSTRSAGWRRSTPTTGGRPGCMVRVTPGVEAHTHEYVMTGQVDSKFGFGLASGDAALAVDRIAGSPAFDLVGVHAHIGSQIFLLHSFEKAVEVLADFVAPLGLPELCLGGGLGVAYVDGEDAPTHHRVGQGPPGGVPGGGDRVPGHGRAGPGHRRRRRPHPLPGGHGQGRPRRAHLRGRRRGDERQPPARPLRQRLRGVPAPGHRRRPAPHRHRGGQALRVGRRRRARRPGAGRPGRGRRPLHPGHRRLRALDGVQLQQGAPAGGGLRPGRRRPGWSCAGRRQDDLLRLDQ